MWALVLLAFTGVTIARPGMRSVTPVYREASSAWLSGQNMYPQRDAGFTYLPQFAILFSPFASAPQRVGDTLWRFLQLGVYVSSIRRLAEAAQSGPKDLFFPISILALPAALGSAMNGQSNMLLAGAMGHASVEVIRGRRWAVAAWLMLGLVAKPIAIVMILLLAISNPVMIPWFLGGMALAAASPLLFDSWPSVAGQYTSWYRQLLVVAPSQEHRFDDISGLLRTLNVHLPIKVSYQLRLLAAGLTPALWLVWARRLRQPDYAFALLGLSAAYLMLFNPRTESNSYVVLSPVIAVMAARLLLVEGRRVGWLLVGLAVALGNASYGDPTWPLTKLWLKPMVALTFVGFLICEVARRRRASEVARPASS
jgi:hypothetical protein